MKNSLISGTRCNHAFYPLTIRIHPELPFQAGLIHIPDRAKDRTL